MPITDDLHHALAEANAAMAEHERLRELERTLAADRITAISEQRQAAAERDSAEADVILAASDPAAIERSETARSRAQAADAALARSRECAACIAGKAGRNG